jgi:hypothetical protein
VRKRFDLWKNEVLSVARFSHLPGARQQVQLSTALGADWLPNMSAEERSTTSAASKVENGATASSENGNGKDVKDVGDKKRKDTAATDGSPKKAKIQTVEPSKKVSAPAELTILDSCSPEYRAMLGQIGFAMWRSNKVPLPVLIQNPMDAPRPVRQQWLDLYHKVRRDGYVRSVRPPMDLSQSRILCVAEKGKG